MSRRLWLGTLLVSSLASGLALLVQNGMREMWQVRTLPERVMEWLLIEWPEGTAAPTDYWMARLGDQPLGLRRLVKTARARWRVEMDYRELKEELGLDHYEGRHWLGWHHHVTLSLLALWFLCCERRRVGGENAGRDRVAGARGHHAAAAGPGAEPGADRGGSHSGVVAEGGGSNLQVAQGHRRLPAPSSASGYQLIR